jgi:hypothetical protein
MVEQSSPSLHAQMRSRKKYLGAKNRHRSATAVARNDPNSPAKCYLRLEPWLELANLLVPDMTKVTKKNGEYTYKELKFKERSDAVFFNRAMRNKTIAPLLSNILSPPSDPPDPPVGPEDRDEVLRAAEQFRRDHPGVGDPTERDFALIHKLAQQVARYFEFCSGKGRVGLQIELTEGSWSIDNTGTRFKTTIFQPSRPFVEALRGAETDRVRRCPEKTCRKFFYATRKDKKACSFRCNNARRMRVLRSRPKEGNRG